MEYFVVLVFLVGASAQHISDRPCPVRPIEQNFDIKKYTAGVWYDVLRYDASFSRGCDCGFANYDLKEDNTVGVRNCCKRLPNTTLSCSLGSAVLSEPEHVPLEGKLNVAFGNRPATISNYWILSTDYDNYSIVYFCMNVEDNKSREFAWLLSRDPQLQPAVKTTAEALIDAHFDRSKMYQAEQSAERCDPRNE